MLPTRAWGGTLLTTNFAANRGPDNTLVDSVSGTLWSGTSCAAPGPCPFNIVFTFSTPFLYNPAGGNLLLDLQGTGYSGSGNGEFDVANYFADPATAAVDEIVSFAGSTPHQEYSDSVTEFFYTPTPEPPTFATLGAGLLIGLLWASHRRRAA